MSDTSKLAEALAAFQQESLKVAKANTADAGTYKYQYADLADITALVLPLLGKHGLSFSAKPTLSDDGRFVLRYLLRHSSGETDGGDYPLPEKGTAQQLGSAITYARRYVLCAITGCAPGGDDDDGTSAKDVQVEARPQRGEWDPTEQQILYDAWAGEIAKASAAEITALGPKLTKQKRDGELSPNTYQRLATLAGKRLAELQTKGGGSE